MVFDWYPIKTSIDWNIHPESRSFPNRKPMDFHRFPKLLYVGAGLPMAMLVE